MSYFMRQATASDATDLADLRSEAETWLAQAGIRQWVPQHHDYSRRVLAQAASNGDAWIVHAPNGDIAGTVTLSGPDLDFWGPDDDPYAALYVSKLIVARAHSGIGLGAAVTNWAADRAAAKGLKFLRLDCRRDNYQLHDYYRAQGFHLVRIMDTPRNPQRKTFSGALFERQITVRKSTDTTDTKVTA